MNLIFVRETSDAFFVAEVCGEDVREYRAENPEQVATILVSILDATPGNVAIKWLSNRG